MALSVFDDKSREPERAALRQVLGRSNTLWEALVSHLAARYPPLEQAWSFAGAKWGWSLRLRQKRRTVLYLTPRERHFLAGFALGEKAVRAAHEAGLPGSALSLIEEAPRYAEGRGVRFEVRTRKDLEIVQAVAAVKMAN